MLTLGQDDILLDRRAVDWRSALDQAATVLGEAGLVTEGYRDGLYARETQSSTYLGNAIAIPHGTPQSREHVKRTGVRVLQFPQGVDWHDGNRVYVLVTIAAQGDAHRDLLERLVLLLDSNDAATLRDQGADQILARLSGESSQAQTLEVRVLNAHGLHARPAKQLVQVARRQPVPVRVRLADDGANVSAASLTKVIGLGARRGQRLIFSAEGEDAKKALSLVCAAVSDGLGEDVLPFAEERESSTALMSVEKVIAPGETVINPVETVPEPLAADQPHYAVAASPGMAIAPVFVMRTPRFGYSESAADASEQQRRLDGAIREAGAQRDTRSSAGHSCGGRRGRAGVGAGQWQRVDS